MYIKILIIFIIIISIYILIISYLTNKLNKIPMYCIYIPEIFCIY